MKTLTAFGQGFKPKQVIGGENAYLKSLVDSGKFTQEKVDDAWKRAKRIATSEAEANPKIVPSYAYTTAIFQRLLGLKKNKTEARVKVNAAARLAQVEAK